MAYNFYIAQVVETAKIGDDRLQVRILPYMEDIDSSKCPLYPSFFKDEQYTGKVGDYVWVICDEEFSLGYIFGLANYNTWSDRATSDGEKIFDKSSDGIQLSIPETLRDKINDSFASVEGMYLNLQNAKITYWDTNCIHYIERNTGGKIIAFSNGTLYVFRNDEFLVKIGKNTIKVGANGVSLAGSDIQIDSTHVGLGHNATMNVLVNDGVSAESALKSKYVFA